MYVLGLLSGEEGGGEHGWGDVAAPSHDLTPFSVSWRFIFCHTLVQAQRRMASASLVGWPSSDKAPGEVIERKGNDAPRGCGLSVTEPLPQWPRYT
jgi:hypothetical protein